MNTKIQKYKDTKIQKLQKYKKSKSTHIKSGLTRSCWLLSLRFGTTRGPVSRTGGSAVGSMKSLVVVREMFFGMVVKKIVKLEHLFLKSILLFVNSIASPVGRATLGRQDPSPENIISTIIILTIDIISIINIIIFIRINLTVDVLIAFIP